RELPPGLGRDRRFPFEKTARRSRDRGQWRPQIMRDGAQQCISQTLGLDLDARGLRLSRQTRALHGQRGLAREGLEETELIGTKKKSDVGGSDPEDARRTSRPKQREEERLRGRKGLRAEPGRLAAVVDPLRDAVIVIAGSEE